MSALAIYIPLFSHLCNDGVLLRHPPVLPMTMPMLNFGLSAVNGVGFYFLGMSPCAVPDYFLGLRLVDVDDA